MGGTVSLTACGRGCTGDDVTRRLSRPTRSLIDAQSSRYDCCAHTTLQSLVSRRNHFPF